MGEEGGRGMDVHVHIVQLAMVWNYHATLGLDTSVCMYIHTYIVLGWAGLALAGSGLGSSAHRFVICCRSVVESSIACCFGGDLGWYCTSFSSRSRAKGVWVDRWVGLECEG